ncbi:MAG: hypothetical protein PHP06_02660 [Clostridia bacterium]|nr:hypothetical protein [Clostridia bacterium]
MNTDVFLKALNITGIGILTVFITISIIYLFIKMMMKIFNK